MIMTRYIRRTSRLRREFPRDLQQPGELADGRPHPRKSRHCHHSSRQQEGSAGGEGGHVPRS